MIDLSLLYDVVWVTSRETCRFQDIHDLRSSDDFLVQVILVFFEPDLSSQSNLCVIDGKSVIAVVKDDLNVGNHSPLSWTLMKHRLTNIGFEVRILVRKNKLNCKEEVTLPRSVSPDDDIVVWTEGIDYSLFPVTSESLDDNLQWMT